MITKRTELLAKKDRLRKEHLESLYQNSLKGINSLLDNAIKNGHKTCQITLSQNEISVHQKLLEDIKEAGYTTIRSESVDVINIVIE